MPRKIRELVRDLEDAGFVRRGGKGSRRRFKHPTGVNISISGNPGDDARPYQERDVKDALKEVRRETE